MIRIIEINGFQSFLVTGEGPSGFIGAEVRVCGTA